MSECRGSKRKYKLTHWDSDTFRWFYYIILYMIRCDMSHAFHIELVITEALSIVIYYCCRCCRWRRHRRYMPLSVLILILFHYYNVNDSRQRIPIETVVASTWREIEKLRKSWHFAFEPIKREPVHFMRDKWTIRLQTMHGIRMLHAVSPMVIDLIKLHWMFASG